jgi:hypothetical protein
MLLHWKLALYRIQFHKINTPPYVGLLCLHVIVTKET